jgi:hypothetical protein
MATLTPIMVALFWARVEAPSEFQCWTWTGRKGAFGYGRCHGTMAHKIAYELINGPIPEGQIIRHSCDNPACCNPRHLQTGTYRDNSADCVTRGRIARGAKHGRTHLTEDDVRYIRTNPDNLKLKDIAAKFCIAPSTASYIRSRRSWRYAA